MTLVALIWDGNPIWGLLWVFHQFILCFTSVKADEFETFAQHDFNFSASSSEHRTPKFISWWELSTSSLIFFRFSSLLFRYNRHALLNLCSTNDTIPRQPVD
jgi:hypothetical protein